MHNMPMQAKWEGGGIIKIIHNSTLEGGWQNMSTCMESRRLVETENVYITPTSCPYMLCPAGVKTG